MCRARVVFAVWILVPSLAQGSASGEASTPMPMIHIKHMPGKGCAVLVHLTFPPELEILLQRVIHYSFHFILLDVSWPDMDANTGIVTNLAAHEGVAQVCARQT